MDDKNLEKNLDEFIVFCQSNEGFPEGNTPLLRSMDAGTLMRLYNRSIDAIKKDDLQSMIWDAESINHGLPVASVVKAYLSGQLDKVDTIKSLEYQREFSRFYLRSKGYDNTIAEKHWAEQRRLSEERLRELDKKVEELERRVDKLLGRHRSVKDTSLPSLDILKLESEVLAKQRKGED